MRARAATWAGPAGRGSGSRPSSRARDVGEGGHAELGAGAAAGGDLVHLGELVPGAGQADFQPFGFTQPVLLLGLGDAGRQADADFVHPWTLAGVGGAAAGSAGVFVDARSVVGAAAVAEGDLAAFEMAEELSPFGVAGGPVLGGRALRPRPGSHPLPRWVGWRPSVSRSLFSVNSETGHGNLIYHRYDGHYGLVSRGSAT